MWYFDDPGLLVLERSAVQELEEANSWLDGVQWRLDPAGITIEANIIVSSECRAITLCFPIHYPSLPPSVKPQEPANWSSHQYGDGGDLCLELGPDNWQPRVHTAANLLESAYRLLTLEADHTVNSETQIPSRHVLTDGQRYRNVLLRWVVTPTTLAGLNKVPEGQAARCSVYLTYHERSVTAFIKKIEFDNGESWSDPSIPESLGRLGQKLQGLIVTDLVSTFGKGPIDNPDTLTSIIESQAIPASQKEGVSTSVDDIKFVIFKIMGEIWTARWRITDSVYDYKTVKCETLEPDMRHGLDAGALQGATVAIVGLGSAGSKIATSLARSGVGHFILMDDDILFPDNLVRHDSDWLEVGMHKADALEERISLINPEANVIRRLHRLNGQESSTSAASALSALSKADVIIDATANPNVFSLCAKTALSAKSTLLWLEIYAGGIGGLIARARPDKDPEPFTLRSSIIESINKIAEEKGAEPPETSINYGMQVDDDEVIVASDSDVAVISAQATQMALDALLSREPSRFPYPAYLVGMMRGWVFEQPFHTLPIECTSNVDWTTDVSVDETTRKEAAEFIKKLLEEEDTSDADTEAPG